MSEARSRREVLVDRLLRARGGETLAEELTARFSSDAEPFATYVAAWKDVTAWLARRLPTQVAEVADPLAALDRLREHLAILEGRLSRQDFDLRGASEDVARGIEVKLRRSTAQVRRLNQHLAGISFGSIAGIRVELRRLERMDQILRALREGQAQELLFQSSLPVEEALEEIFRRYGGGKTGGQRLLDYREYLELEVEVERKGKPGFETASPTRLSTGEAIGVGAALMMVVLTEWERDANLFRTKKADGTLRFLFLDEANRLSQDNLGVLFDLCETLELQLLIAAPEVARASGNTTYRLVRQVAEDGSEEVIVTGRRATKDAREPESAQLEQGEQGALLD
jgi:chromosome partition protein MukB